MSIAIDRAQIEQYFLNNWNSTTTPVRLFDSPELLKGTTTLRDENGLTSWVRLTILPAASQQSEITLNSRQRNIGVVKINVFVLNKLGAHATATTIAETAKAMFYRKRVAHVQFKDATYTFDGVRDQWLQITVNVSYYADHSVL